MKQITNIMINEFKIKQLGYDFMGYKLQKGDVYTYHHLIIPNRNGGPETKWNGAILCGKTAHPYLHLIEHIDYDMFCYITSEMIDENIKGFLDTYNIKKIHEVLIQFEKEHCYDTNKKGRYLIKDIYYKRKKFID